MSVCTIFVFMALMEYCIVNIVLGDTTIPKINKNKQPVVSSGSATVPPMQPQPTAPTAFPYPHTKVCHPFYIISVYLFYWIFRFFFLFHSSLYIRLIIENARKALIPVIHGFIGNRYALQVVRLYQLHPEAVAPLPIPMMKFRCWHQLNNACVVPCSSINFHAVFFHFYLHCWMSSIGFFSTNICRFSAIVC